MEDTPREEIDEKLDAPSSEETPGAPETLEGLRSERDEYLALWKRAQADYKNLRRRALAELEAGVRAGMLPLLENLLLVLDHLDMALAAPTPSEDAKNFAVGVQMTRDQLQAALEREDVSEIETGGPFDPELHQAVATVPSETTEPGSIVETVRKGYTWRETILRHAQVRVAAAVAATEGESQGSESDEIEAGRD